MSKTDQKTAGTEPKADNNESKTPVKDINPEMEALQRELAEAREAAQRAAQEKQEAEEKLQAEAQRAEEAETKARAAEQRAEEAEHNNAKAKPAQKPETVRVVSATEFSYRIEGVLVTPDVPVQLERRFGNLLDCQMKAGLIKIYE